MFFIKAGRQAVAYIGATGRMKAADYIHVRTLGTNGEETGILEGLISIL